jgi:hypothetical protein
MKPKKLEFQALKYISDNYLEGDEDKLEEEKIEEDIESFSGNVDMEKVDKILQEAIDKLEEGEFDRASDMDGFVAPRLHEATDITRREAADPEFWNYMSLIFKPEFVRKRWPSCAKNRFVMRTSTDRHALSRLWWIAELTERDGDYRYTEIAFSNQDIAQNIFDNDFSHFEQILPPVLERLEDSEKTSSVATKYGEILNRRFAVLLEEDMEDEQLEELADEVHKRALQEIEMENS